MVERAFQAGEVSYDAVASDYPFARALSNESAEIWTRVLEPFVQKQSSTVLDLGCGTGRFSTLIAERFEVTVLGLDASFAMVQQANKTAPGAFCVGRAEELPLPDASFDVIWLSQVIHHVAGRSECAKELRRVIRPNGHLLVRGGAFGDRLDCYPTHLQFFPGARRIASEFPKLSEILRIVREAGFSLTGFRSIPQETCRSLREFAERTRLRVDTTLRLLSDDEYQKCQAALEKAAAKERVPTPVIEHVDFLILEPNA